MYRPHPLKFQTLKLVSLSAFLIIVSITVFSTAATYLAVKPLKFSAPDALPVQAQIMFSAELLSVDASARTLEIDWYPALAIGCNPDPGIVADIYFDSNLLDSSSPSFTSLPPFVPAYQYNTSLLCSRSSTIAEYVFRTVIKLLGTYNNPEASTMDSSLQDYPFDVYTARISMYAVDHITGEFITLNITHSFGIAVNFEVTPRRTLTVGGLDVPPELWVDLQVARSKAAIAFVILTAVSNWLVTSAFLVISAAAVVYPSPKHYNEMFVLPVGQTFLGLPRALGLGSVMCFIPSISALTDMSVDLFSILPVLVIVTLCILSHSQLQQQQLRSDKLCRAERTNDVSIAMESPSSGSIINASTDEGDRLAVLDV
ncbi:hypothetical protein HYPSUDRAFT_55557 [Hypholoma sublateritium FD-334 SS-4]|uniref:Transmembrane protein n=1 Tax=Hypholoma sublateritium (strain FD-334 SS-4) TaxID=945553 RepID=A0A0D2MCS8_HYPSF|nr:hypothetical protein HYPSUDRAFT_55557 [Hypholoma sublateritium FD-334 SS-4]